LLIADSNGTAAATPKKKQARAIEFGSAEHKAIWDRFQRRLQKHEDNFKRQLKKQIQRQQNDVLRAFRQETRSGEGETKVHIPLPSLGSLFNIAFTLRNPLTDAAIQQMTLEFAEQVNKTTEDGIRQALAEAQREGLSIPQTQDLLNGVFNGRKSDFETERIARTEMTEAANTGQLESWRQARADGIHVKKSWLAALDDRVRDTHAAAHAKYQADPIPLEQDFEVGGCKGPNPGAMNCVEENVFCRCTMIAEEI
jgi:hypothetical protein